MKTAFVYDWLVSLGGGERVLEALNKLYPSPIYTLVHDKSLFLDQCVHSSFIQGLPFSRKWYRYYLPFFPLAIEQFDLREYDVVLSLSHAVAKGALTHAHQLHLCYCFTPMRYAWDLYHAHMLELSRGKRNLCALLLHYLRSWDQSSVSRVDQFAAVSKYIARRIQKIYNRPATVIYPPVATHLFQGALPRENFYLTVSRLVPYKRIDLLVEAFSYMPDKQLIVIGEGPEEKKLKQKHERMWSFWGTNQILK